MENHVLTSTMDTYMDTKIPLYFPYIVFFLVRIALSMSQPKNSSYRGKYEAM
jgi:hypothetical protein